MDRPEALGALLLVVALVGSLLWNASLAAWRWLERTLTVRRVAARLGDPSIGHGRSVGEGTFVQGRLEGRVVRVGLDHLRGDYLRCAVQLENALDGLVIYPTHGSSERLLATQRRTGRIQSLGQEHLDAKYTIQGVAPEDAARLFRSGRAEAALDQLFGPQGVLRVTTEDGWLVATRRLRRQALADESIRILQTLTLVAPLFSRRELRLQLQGRSFACTDASGAICPYCRDGLATGEGAEPLARCESCRTVHHQGCFEEAGGCTVLGCASQARTRRRVRV